MTPAMVKLTTKMIAWKFKLLFRFVIKINELQNAYPNQFHKYVAIHEIFHSMDSSFTEKLPDALLEYASFFVNGFNHSPYFDHLWSGHDEM